MPLAMLKKKVEGRDRVNVTCTSIRTYIQTRSSKISCETKKLIVKLRKITPHNVWWKSQKRRRQKGRTFLTKERRFSSSCYAFYSYLQQRKDREEGSSEEDLQNMLVGSFPRKPKKIEEINPVYSDWPYTIIKLLLFQCY